ncbi:MIP/aquaporin family protein [Myceligenerans cantabricum]
MSIAQLFVTEMLGTTMLLLLGCSVVANAILPGTKGSGAGAGWLLISFGWGLAVFAGVFVAFKSGAHINPAVTIGLMASGAEELGPGIPATAGNAVVYIAAQLTGGVLGAVLTYLAYKKHFDQEAPGATKLAVFSTGPEIRSYGWNLVTEIIGTFVLVFVVLSFANWPGDLGPLAVALLVVGIGASLGGPTGYAINPARDLGPRIAHAILPIKGKGGSDWSYSWVPVVGPIVGGVLAGLLAPVVAFG